MLVGTPYHVILGMKISRTSNGIFVDQSHYIEKILKKCHLRYATDCTRPDIAYVVGVFARFTSKPNFEHWNAMTQLMRYFKKNCTVWFAISKISCCS